MPLHAQVDSLRVADNPLTQAQESITLPAGCLARGLRSGSSYHQHSL